MKKTGAKTTKQTDTAKEALQKLKSKPVTDRISKPHQLLKRFGALLIEHEFVTYNVPWPRKDEVFVKQYLKKAGEHALPAMERFVKMYREEGKSLIAAQGDKTGPRPAPGQLAKYSSEIVNAYLAAGIEKVKMVARKEPTTYNVAEVDEPEEQPASLGDVEKILKTL